LIPVSTGNSLTAMIAIMSASLMMAGAGMLAYHVLVGAVASAHDGVPTLGMHTVWSPIQFCVGFGLLSPIPGLQGLDGMQLAVYQVAKLGSATADSMWSSFVAASLPTSGTNPQNSGFISSDLVSALTITRQVADLELCQAIHKIEGQTVDTPLPAAAGVTGTDAITWSYGDCGSMSMPLASPAPAEAENTDTAEMTAMQNATTAYQNARHAALTALVTSLRSDSTVVAMEKGSVANSGIWPATAATAQIVTSLTGYATTYDTAMQAAATAYLSTRDADVYSRLRSDAASLGWMSAGSYWRTLAQIGNNLSQLQSAPPDFGAPDFDNYLDFPSPTDRDSQVAIRHFDIAWSSATATTRLTAADLSAGGNRSGGVLDRIIGPMWNPIATSLVNLASVNAADPESTFSKLGANLTLAGSIGIVAGTAASALTGNAAGKFVGLGSAWNWLSGFATLAIEACLGLGLFLSYVLPMLPWIAVLWLIVGWATFILEALVAAPLYALLFVRCDGKEFIGGVQTPGFVLLFNLFLFPCLGIAGLGAAFYLLPLLTEYLVSQFADAFIGQQGGGIVGLFGLLTGAAILIWLEVVLSLKTLELVHQMPATIPRWLGSSLGGSADGVSESSNRMYAAVSSTSSKAMAPAAKAISGKPGVAERPGGGGEIGSGGGGEGGSGGGGSVAPRED
jgi:conjugal transfer/type IV secretion protein DotA/TraY